MKTRLDRSAYHTPLLTAGVAPFSDDGTRWGLNEDEWTGRVLCFQNTGTDIAFNIVITDMVPATVDPSSVSWGASAH